MPRNADKQQEIYCYLLETFKRIYNSEQTKKFKRAELIRFPSQESIINFVYRSPRFVESSSYSQDTLQPDQISVSRNTIRKAISQLVIDNKIEQTKTGYQYIPQYEDKIRKHPVLDIASQIPVHIGIPENILLLTVENGMAESVADYLSAQFFRNDIIFLPIGSHILCISLLPASVIADPLKQITPFDSNKIFRSRIELILHQFKLDHRDFPYSDNYETEYLIKYHPEIKKDLWRIAKILGGDTVKNYTSLQKVLMWDREALLKSLEPEIFIDHEDEDDEEYANTDTSSEEH